MKTNAQNFCEVLIIGGGPAGMSCGLSIARGGGSLIICDNKNPRNKNASGIRNLPGHEGISPAVYHELLKSDLMKYGTVQFRDITVTDVKKIDGFFHSTLSDNEIITSKKVVFTEGLKDILPPLLGIETFWGKSVFHCAYCHAYEGIGKEFGMMASNKNAIQMLRLLRGLSSNIKVFINDEICFEEHEIKELEKFEISFIKGKIVSLEGHNNILTGVRLESGEMCSCDTLFVQNKTEPRSDMGKKLGCAQDEDGIYIVDESGRSNVPGVYFAGDVGSHYHSVIMASAIGSHVGICVNADLMREVFEKY